ncbi:MAG: cobalamin biosynthesis protein [Desulfovibrionaceae bacterium]|nr:cobalamin biosynthesis protein [Desulfovibrionaceae bacterium]MBF0514878.1 cobalamin biosynthesis protein [Desulfovibrionaceae bacterium]
MPGASVAVYALTPQGAELGRRLADELAAELYTPVALARASRATGFASLPALMADIFQARSAHVFIAACGLVVRAVAPHLRGKDLDPAVVVLDQQGRYAVSLLSGHLGGANELARQVAALTGGAPVITTATDCLGLPSFDVIARDLGLAIDNLDAVKHCNAALISGERIVIFDPAGRLSRVEGLLAGRVDWAASPQELPPDAPCLVVDWRVRSLGQRHLALRPKVLAVGVGCRKGADADAVLEAVRAALAVGRLSPLSVRVLASIEAKRHEPGILAAADALGAKAVFFSARELGGAVAPNPSAMVAKHMGVSSVCEAAAMIAAGTTRLLATKIKTRAATAAVALDG